MAGIVRYRVLKKCFVNGSLYDPAASSQPIYVEGPPGLESDALALAPDAGKPVDPGTAAPRGALLDNGDKARIADLEAKLAERDDDVAAAENAVADLQAKLDEARAAHVAELAERDQKIADLERQIADLTAPKPKTK